VHQNNVPARVPLSVGDVVSFEIGQGRDGRKHAVDVVPIEDSDARIFPTTPL
jgi:hypothetical protein